MNVQHEWRIIWQVRINAMVRQVSPLVRIRCTDQEPHQAPQHGGRGTTQRTDNT